MKRLVYIFCFTGLFLGFYPSNDSLNHHGLTLKPAFESKAYNDARGFVQQHNVLITFTESKLTDDGFCLRDCAEMARFESCSPGQEPCGADYQTHIVGTSCPAWQCHSIDYISPGL